MESRSNESRSSYQPSSSYSASSESRESSESRSSFKPSSSSSDSSESREPFSSGESKTKYAPASEYTDRVVKVPVYSNTGINNSIYITYRGERKVITRDEVEAFKAKLVYPEDYETLLDILEQTTPKVSHTTPELTEELQKREIMIAELRQKVIAQKTRESLVKDNEELNKILGLHK